MKKILWIISVAIALLWIQSSYASSISQSELDKQIKEWNILSDAYSTQLECTNLKDKYNQEFSNYKRSECFLNASKYYYFICPSSSACSVNLVTATQTVAATSNENVPNKEKLDVFLAKVASMRKELNDDTKYKTILSQVKWQLQTLWTKYSSNTIISQMLTYLHSWVDKIQTDLANTSDVDDFLCELLGNCNVKKIECPVMDAPLCQYGGPISKGTYKNADGCEFTRYECPTAPTPNNCPQRAAPFCEYGSPILKGTYKNADGCEFINYECPASTTSSSSSSSTSSWGGTTSSSSSSSWWATSSSSSSSSSWGWTVKDYSSYPSWSWEPQAEMNDRYKCTGTVPTYAEVWPLNYVWFQSDAPGKNSVWRSVYSLSDADRNSDVWKSCAWYCDMSYSWNGNRCVSVGNIRFSTTQVKIWETISGTVTTAWYTDSYYTCMETPALPNNCANGANFSQISKNPDWKLNGTTFTLTNYPITSAFQTGQYTWYVAVAENGVVKDPHRTARRHSFNVVPGDTGSSTPTVTPATISFSISWDILRGEVYSSNPSNTWACMDAPWSNTCSDRSTWTKMPAPGWVQTSFGFALSNLNVAWSARWKYTWYIVIDKNGSIWPRGSSSFTY